MKRDNLTASIINAIGVQRLASLVNVTPRIVRQHRQNGLLPAQWAVIVRAEAEKLDPPRMVPDRCFTFKQAKEDESQ